MNQQQDTGTFYGLGIAPKLLDILDKLKFSTPTPIQRKSIPIALEGKDMIGIAQTGTGKTLAFGIPAIQRLGQQKGQGLIILPTRELAIQVDETLQKIGKELGLRTAVLIGGTSMGPQVNALRRNPHIIVSTPGRLLDHMEQKTISLNAISILVLDEADRMLDMGFAPQIKRILEKVPKERQTMLFSATMPSDIVKIARTHMKLPVQVEIARAGTTAEKITHELFVVAKPDKIRLLEKILADYRGSVLVFSRTKHGAKKITQSVKSMNQTVAEIHSNKTLSQRRMALEGFKSGRFRVLIATDIAARGIDVVGIELVINFDLPDNAEDYVHRIGRTGRAGRAGHAISFATPDQGRDVRDIENLIRVALPVSKLPELPPGRARQSFEDDRPRFQSRRPFGSRPGGRSTSSDASSRRSGPPRHRSAPPRRSGPSRYSR